MLLLVESGATRSHWAIMNRSGEVVKFTSTGFNPNYHTLQHLATLIQQLPKHLLYNNTYQKVVFYGAGCAQLEKSTLVKSLLLTHFPRAQVEVYGDLLGAAHGLLGKSKGVVLILGTGANAGYYNGKTLTKVIPALGYLMGDHGSGAHLGRLLVTAYMHRELPTTLSRRFEAFTGHNRETLVGAIYSHPSPGNYLASMAPFLSENISYKILQSIVMQSFSEFLVLLRRFLGTKMESEMVATGSVAAHFAPFLSKAFEIGGLKLSKIVPSPFEGLISFYSTNRSK